MIIYSQSFEKINSAVKLNRKFKKILVLVARGGAA